MLLALAVTLAAAAGRPLITVTVYDAATKKPLAGAEASIYASNERPDRAGRPSGEIAGGMPTVPPRAAGGPKPSKLTDARGRVSWSDAEYRALSPGQYRCPPGA